MQISEKAAVKLKEIIGKQKNPQSTMLRIAFGGFGWGGPKLQLTLDELTHKNDKLTESQGIKIVYTHEIEQYIANSIIEYSDSFLNRGFSIKGSSLSSC